MVSLASAGRIKRRKAGSGVFTHQGIAVSAWVTLDSECSLKSETFGDELAIEFGPGSSLGLVIAEGMIDRLAVVLADAQEHFRELDAKATATEAEWDGGQAAA